MSGVLPVRVARLILVFSYLAFISSLAGLAYALYAHLFVPAFLFAVSLL